MRLQEITLVNIGAYKRQTFNFKEYKKSQNVILIGGKNGSGKTTFLNAIKLGLFGPYAYGYKHLNDDYLKKIKGILNLQEQQNKSAFFQISISFREVENYQVQDMIIYRTWEKVNNFYRESVEIVQNGRHLTDSESELYQSRMREISPRDLFDLCILDGEEISEILNRNRLPVYLESLANNLFNLNLFRSLEEDLKAYTDREMKSAGLSEKEHQLQEWIREEKGRCEEYQVLSDQVMFLEERINKVKEDYAEEKRYFNSHGGLIKEERERIQNEIKKIEEQRRSNDNELKEFISRYLPFLLSKSLLKEVQGQLVWENEQQVYEEIEKKLSLKAVKRIIDSLPVKQDNESAVELLRQNILSELKPTENTAGAFIHRASFKQRNQIEEINNYIQETNAQYFINLIELNQRLLEQLQELRKKLRTNDSTNEFAQMLQQMEDYQKEIAKSEIELEQLKLRKTKLKEQLKELQQKINNMREEVSDSERSKSAFGLSQRITLLSQQFRQMQIQKRLQEVQIEAYRMLSRLMRKKEYIDSLIIDPETYHIELKDREGMIVNHETLSAGERQLLLLSIIWAMFRCSGHRYSICF